MSYKSGDIIARTRTIHTIEIFIPEGIADRVNGGAPDDDVEVVIIGRSGRNKTIRLSYSDKVNLLDAPR